MNLIVVTGSSRGLGLSLTKRLLKENYRVLGIARRKSQEFNELEKEFTQRLFFEEFDFNNTGRIHEMVKLITKKHGSVYGLINNAALGYDGVLATMHEKQIAELLRVNIEAPILLTKYVSRSMLMKLSGRIINISSIIASTGFNGLSVYGATKSSLNGFTKSLSRELGKAKITVNSIAPGYMETAMTNKLDDSKLESIKRRSPLGHLATVEDVSGAVLFLLSDEAKSITGSIITVDAGTTA